MEDIKEKRDEEILVYRAKELAQKPRNLIVSRDLVALLEFKMFGVSYAVYLEQVEAVGKFEHVIPIPTAAPHVSGIIQYKGQSVALISIPRFFNSDKRGIVDADFAIVVSAKHTQFAIQAEDIHGVCQLEKQDLLRPPDDFTTVQLPFISYITEDGIAIINLDRLVEAEGFVMV